MLISSCCPRPQGELCCDAPRMSIDSSWRIRRISLCVTHTVQTTQRPASHVRWISTNIIMTLNRERGSVLCILFLTDSDLPKKKYRARCPLINCLAFILLFIRRSKSGEFYHMHYVFAQRTVIGICEGTGMESITVTYANGHEKVEARKIRELFS